ncbi:hypothetical protein [Micromonospora sp. NPDC049679]|uniref:hypothetical protein n=1 Tax=Micromonospora sp. NPDC049679 TaxID=3155920 RepID=UPI0033CF914F
MEYSPEFSQRSLAAYRYRDEATRGRAATAPDLHDALRRVADEGWSHLILDGKVFTSVADHADRGEG